MSELFHQFTMHKIPKFHLISWSRNFVERHSFRRGSGELQLSAVGLFKDVREVFVTFLLISVIKGLKLVYAIFIKFLFFHQMIALKKICKMFLISSKKLFSFLRYSIFFYFSPRFHTFQTQKDKWMWNNLCCHQLACINLQMQFLEEIKNFFTLHHQTQSDNI